MLGGREPRLGLLVPYNAVTWMQRNLFQFPDPKRMINGHCLKDQTKLNSKLKPLLEANKTWIKHILEIFAKMIIR